MDKRYLIGEIWPTIYDYELVLEDLPESMLDPELRNGKIERNPRTRRLVPRSRPDTHICLYRIDNWIVRFFCQPENNERIDYQHILQRYRMLDRFINQHLDQVSSLLPLHFVEPAIQVNCFKRDLVLGKMVEFLRAQTMPLVKIPFVNGTALNTFILRFCNNQPMMRQLCEVWWQMINELEEVQMAHGDLDVTNVLVIQDTDKQRLFLKLLDYENSWIPDFAPNDFSLPEQGHEFFQHPAFFRRTREFNATIDRFPALVIYISLLVLTEFPELYQQWGLNDNRLIFNLRDYQDEQQGVSEVFRYLSTLNINGLDPYLNELSACLREGRQPQSLREIGKKMPSPPLPPEPIQETIYMTTIDWNTFVPRDPPTTASPPPSSPSPGPNSQPLNLIRSEPGLSQQLSHQPAENAPLQRGQSPSVPLFSTLPQSQADFALSQESTQPVVSPRPPLQEQEPNPRPSHPPFSQQKVENISPHQESSSAPKPMPALEREREQFAQQQTEPAPKEIKRLDLSFPPYQEYQQKNTINPIVGGNPFGWNGNFIAPGQQWKLPRPPEQQSLQPDIPPGPAWQQQIPIVDHRVGEQPVRGDPFANGIPGPAAFEQRQLVAASDTLISESTELQAPSFDKATWLGCFIVLLIIGCILFIGFLVLRVFVFHSAFFPNVPRPVAARGFYVGS